MPIWDEEQLNKLKHLKRNIQKQERETPSISHKADYVSNPASRLDTLFTRFSAPGEGIQYSIDGKWISASFGEFDKIIFKLAHNMGTGVEKTAIGLPHVPVGISTWLAVSLMISNIVFSRDTVFPDSKQLESPKSRWIMIASRERWLRDLYLSQRCKFSNQPFSIESFPIYRFKRDGTIIPISWAYPNELSSPVLFYHFDNIDSTHADISHKAIKLIVAEISESDTRLGRVLLDRLETIRGNYSNPRSLLFFNSFDDQMRNNLKRMEYKIVHIKPDSSTSMEDHDIPTIEEVFSKYSNEQKINVELVKDDSGISNSLYECARELAYVNEQITSPECRAVLSKWWNLWRTLKDLAVPMETYERFRMHAQGRGSIENHISSISNLASRIQSSEGKSLVSVAPVISTRLKNIYGALSQSCPKADRLKQLLEESKSTPTQDTLFILNEKGQVDALRESFLFSDISLLEHDFPFTYFSRAVSTSRNMNYHTCVIPGVWAPWQDSILIALGTPTIKVLMYQYEIGLLETRLRQHANECASLEEDTLLKTRYLPIISIPQEQSDILNLIKETIVEEAPDIQTPKWMNIESQYSTDSEDSDDISISGDSIVDGGFVIAFDDGTEIVSRPHSEMMLVTDDSVDTVFAADLSVGDTIAVLRDDYSRSLFRSLLGQVNHLLKVDERVLDLWKVSLETIRFRNDNTNKIRSVSSIIRALHDRGCRRADLTIRQWFRGITLAPIDKEDIGRILDIAGVQRPYEYGQVISREINIIRSFNRRLGKRIRKQLKSSFVGKMDTVASKQDRIDFEIDEAIEAVEYKTISSINNIIGEYQ